MMEAFDGNTRVAETLLLGTGLIVILYPRYHRVNELPLQRVIWQHVIDKIINYDIILLTSEQMIWFFKTKITMSTHAEKTAGESVSFTENANFEHVVTTPHFTVPPEKDVKRFLRKHCGPGIWSKGFFGYIMPSTPISEWSLKRLNIFRLVHDQTSAECLAFIKENNGIAPNVYGLAIAVMTVRYHLPSLRFSDQILGFDEKKSVPVRRYGIVMVPTLTVDVNSSIEFDWEDWGGTHCVKNSMIKKYLVFFSH